MTEREVALRDELLAIMKRHKRDHYLFDGVEISVVSERERVKVKISKDNKNE
jgi:hypothetical protein